MLRAAAFTLINRKRQSTIFAFSWQRLIWIAPTTHAIDRRALFCRFFFLHPENLAWTDNCERLIWVCFNGLIERQSLWIRAYWKRNFWFNLQMFTFLSEAKSRRIHQLTLIFLFLSITFTSCKWWIFLHWDQLDMFFRRRWNAYVTFVTSWPHRICKPFSNNTCVRCLLLRLILSINFDCCVFLDWMQSWHNFYASFLD